MFFYLVTARRDYRPSEFRRILATGFNQIGIPYLTALSVPETLSSAAL
jgi:hypothetical protein